MKRLGDKPLHLSILALSAIGFVHAAPDDLTTRKILFASAPRTASAPVLDGDLNDACWQNARRFDVFHLTAGERETNGRENPVKYPTTARVTFDDTHLYVAFECLEPDVKGLKAGAKLHDDPDIGCDDRVEVFLDVAHDHRHYWELAVNPAGVQFDQAAFQRLPGSRTCDFFPEQNLFWRAKTKVGADRWTAEIAIDVTSFGIAKLDEGMTWGFNLARVRRPALRHGDETFSRPPGEGAEYSAWAPVHDTIDETISNFHVPMEFGDLVLGEPGFVVDELRLPSAKFGFGGIGRPTEFGWNPLEVKLHTSDGSARKISVALSVEPTNATSWQASETREFRSGEAQALRYYVTQDAESKVTLRLVDPLSGRQLYRTSYVETAPPLIEFDLAALYSGVAHPGDAVKFRLRTDAQTRATAELRLAFQSRDGGTTIQSAVVSDLAHADQLAPVFDFARLRALPGGDYVLASALVAKGTGEVLGAFRQPLTKPAAAPPRAFSAERTTHSFGGIAGDAVRVQFPFAAQFVFWRGANYIPWWEMDQMAFSNEYIECWGGGGQGCNEPMQDRECRYSRVELLESSPARAVVHWRYALNDAHYRIFHNEWVDEYYTLYPDGVGVRRVLLWANSDEAHEVLDTLMVKPPGVHTAQMFEPSYATLANLAGERHGVPEFSANRALYNKFLRDGKDFILEVNFKDRMHPFTVFALRDELLPGVTPGMISVARSMFQNSDQRGHWPASRYAIDGYNAVGLDVPTHFAFGNIHMPVHAQRQPNAWTFLIGATEPNSDVPAAHAKSWLYPAALQVTAGGATARGYDVNERAYRVAVPAGAARCALQLTAAHEGMFHPVFLLETVEEPTRVSVDGRALATGEYATGRTRHGETVVFLNVALPRVATVAFDLR